MRSLPIKAYSLEQVIEFTSSASFVQAMDQASEEVEKGNVKNAQQIMLDNAMKSNTHVKYQISDWVDEFKERQKIREDRKLNPAKYFYVPSPYKSLNRIIDGIQPGELASVTAITSGGKSMMLHDWGGYNLIAGIPITHVTIENTLWQSEQRYDSRIMGMPYDSFKKFDFTAKQLRQLDRNIEAIRKYIGNMLKVIKCPQDGTTIIDIEQAIRELELKGFYTKFIIVDYADIMTPVKKYESFRLSQAGAYWDIKGLAVTRNLPILTATQAKVEYGMVDKKGRVPIPKAESAGESYWKPRILDIMFTLYQTVKQKFVNETTLHIAKNRDGRRGDEITLIEDFQNVRFLEVI
jgi:replicative DNA helicase